MSVYPESFQNKIISLKSQISILTSLPKLIKLPPNQDLSERQWQAIETQLFFVSSKLTKNLDRLTAQSFPEHYNAEVSRDLNLGLAQIELDLSKSLIFFDTFVDILSQRLIPELGILLKGADVLTNDAVKQIKHPLINSFPPSMTYLDRGVGSSIIREGVMAPGYVKNPVPIIQTTYNKLKQKYLLSSLLHEIAHQCMATLGLKDEIVHSMKKYMKNAGAPKIIQDLFAKHTSEVGPDFFSFLIIGCAQTIATREILSFGPKMVFKVSLYDHHPAMWLRIQISINWCKYLWGFGDWDKWERDWLEMYPLRGSKHSPPENTRRILELSAKYIPNITEFYFKTKFRSLGNRSIPQIYASKPLDPVTIKEIFKDVKRTGKLNLKDLPPCKQLGIFIILKYTGNISEEKIDNIMTLWLRELAGASKRTFI